ncbi:hypothetical protein HII31_11870 [Pseudocercospora fuligena]|uniref:Uncharacterized protein n=1 Tax=Pseudocercospora fuligena TaxID=685502 RepID=A0A8H6R942_9PEZI|nr:hypothetical protein HII31_11870 [Pseudocercospora fuligena]
MSQTTVPIRQQRQIQDYSDSEHHPPSYHVELGIDIGTAFLRATYRIYSSGGAAINEPTAVNFGDADTRETAARTRLANVAGKWLVGWDLEAAIRDRLLSPDEVMYWPKLFLYDLGSAIDTNKDDNTTKMLSKASAQLGEHKSVMIEAILSHILAKAKACVKKDFSRILGPERAPNLATDVIFNARLAVPEMWIPSARVRIRSIVVQDRSPLPLRVFAGEARCALASFIDTVHKSKESLPVKAGDHILMVDLGAGTGDLGLYQLTNELAIGSSLRTIATDSSSRCGSSHISKILYATIRQRITPSEMTDFSERLGIDQSLIDTRLLRSMEQLAEWGEWEPTVTRDIFGVGDESVAFHITREDIKRAHNEVLGHCFEMIESVLSNIQEDCCAKVMMVVSGGYSKNPYLKAQILERYGPGQVGMNICFHDDFDKEMELAVAKGALSSRYPRIKPQLLPKKYSYGILVPQQSSLIPNDYDIKAESEVPMYYMKEVLTSDEVEAEHTDKLIASGKCWLPARRPVPRIDLVILDSTFERNPTALTSIDDVYSSDPKLIKGARGWRPIRIYLKADKLIDQGFDLRKGQNGDIDRFLVAGDIRLVHSKGNNIVLECAFPNHDRSYTKDVRTRVWTAEFSDFLESDNDESL